MVVLYTIAMFLQRCVCSPLLEPGCQCDPLADNADDFCGLDERCLGNCQCALCPESPGANQGSDPRANKPLNPPLMFVIDTTKSVKPDKDSIFNLTQKVVTSIKIDSINIPRFTLVSFNDFGPDINKNVKIEVNNSKLLRDLSCPTVNILHQTSYKFS